MTLRERLAGAPASPRCVFGYRNVVVLVPRRPELRSMSASRARSWCSFILAAAVLAIIAIGMGDYPAARSRNPSARPGPASTASWWWSRGMPVAIAAVVFGALLGIGGAIFQSMTRTRWVRRTVIGFRCRLLLMR